MEQQKLTAFINDSSELAINLEWAGTPFEPADEWALIFTAKDSDDDLDSSAVFQKASGAGIAVSGSVATVELVPSDTELLTDGRRLFDVQAQNILSGKVRTVAFGEVYVMRDITRLTETSVPVSTTEGALPFARTATEIHAATTKVTPVDVDEFGFWDSVSGLIRKASWANIKATLKTYFDGIYQAIGSYATAAQGALADTALQDVTPAAVLSATGGMDAGQKAGMRAAIDITSASYASGLRGAFDPMRIALESGRSCELVVVGDSTANGTDEWFEKFALEIDAAFPGIRHVRRIINTTTHAWDETVVQAGSGDRYIAMPATNGAPWSFGNADAPHPTAAFSVEGKLRIESYAGNHAKFIGGHWSGTSANRVWRMQCLNTGCFQFQFYDAGGTLRTLAQTIPFTSGAGADFWFRFEFTPDNGSTQAQIVVKESADGVTWTTLQTATLAGSYSLRTPSAAPGLFIGGFSGDMMVNTRIYHVYLRDGAGKMASPYFVDSAEGGSSSFDHTFGGSPVLLSSNFSWSGYHTAQTLAAMGSYGPALFVRSTSCVLFVNTSHNDTFGGSTTSAMSSFITNGIAPIIADYQTYSPSARAVFVAQNPKNSTDYLNGAHALRLAAGIQWAAQNNYPSINFYQSIIDDGRDLSVLISDGTHPDPLTTDEIMVPILRHNFDR